MTERQARRIFNEERSAFATVFPSAARVTLRIYAQHYLLKAETCPRDVAWFDPNQNRIGITRASLTLSEGMLRGVLRHELGHAVDTRLQAPGCEKRADRFAKQVSGVPIRYTKSGMQHVSHGKPRRPAWLHQ